MDTRIYTELEPRSNRRGFKPKAILSKIERHLLPHALDRR
jgi:hypothetical protein